VSGDHRIIVPARLQGRQPDGLALCPPLEWMRQLRNGIDVSSTVKATGYAIALHAHPNGTEARMSVQTLVWQTNTSEATARRAITELMDMWLLCVTDRGSAHGRQAVPTTYVLTTHDAIGVYTVSREQWIKSRKRRNRGHR
jgi:hypothetical protein